MEKRPDAVIRFELPRDEGGYGTYLQWTLEVDEPIPDDGLVGHMRKRRDWNHLEWRVLRG